MRAHDYARGVALATAFLMITAACGTGADTSSGEAARDQGPPAAGDQTPAAGAPSEQATELTATDLDAYAKGIARETELVRAARERARTVTTPQARGEAEQATWEDQTIPEGAKAAGLSAERYRAVRSTVHDTFRWLDFQGKIEGPMELDTARATPDMKERFGRDPFDALSPASRAALKAQMNRLVPAWIEYVKLTAVAG
jgi:hypothetical protein